MIPKTIHYCWLSGDPMPRTAVKCMETWRRVMPEYEIKLWDKNSFDVSSAPLYVRQAVEKRKWAFAADYIRMWAVHRHGGIYLDSDVVVRKPFGDFLHHSFFSSMEYHPSQVEKTGSGAMVDSEGRRTAPGYVSGIQVQAAVIGGEAGNPFAAKVLEHYSKTTFIRPDGSIEDGILSPYIYARLLEPYGFRYVDRDQELPGGIMIYRSEIFAGNKREATQQSYAVHLCAHGWKPSPAEKLKRAVERLIGRGLK